jgi:hypothetical protein
MYLQERKRIPLPCTTLEIPGFPAEAGGDEKTGDLMPSERAHILGSALRTACLLAESLELLPAVIALAVLLVGIEDGYLHGTACRTRHTNTSRQGRISHGRI